MALALIDNAARNHSRLTKRGILEGAFAQMFSNFVYSQIWEDPRVDMEALGLGEHSRVATISSGGCNVMTYLTKRPARLTVVDLNPSHLALLELKLVAARHLQRQETFFDLFGKADIRGNIDIYDRELAHRLTPKARAFWNGRNLFGRRRINYLAKGLYRYGTLGRSIHLGQLVCKLHGRNPCKLLDAKSPWEQREIYFRELDPLFDSKFVRLAMRLPASLYGLGIPPAQFDELMSESPNAPSHVVRQRLRRLFCDFPINDNYFAHQALSFRYGDSFPDYLQQNSFETLKECAAGVDLQNTSMTQMLRAEEPASFTSYVLLDAQDWMTAKQLTELWQQIDRTAEIGARVIFRTAGVRSPLESAVPPQIIDRWRYLEKLSQRLHAKDRSAIYGGFHTYECAA